MNGLNNLNTGFNHKPIYILFLKGIKLSDLTTIEDMFDEKLMGNVCIMERIQHNNHQDDTSSILYKSNPNTFTSYKTWVKNSNCKCWECTCMFNESPVFIPLYIRKNDLGCIEMGVYGNFCWFNCAQKWINEKCKIDGTHDDKTRMLKILYEMFTGNKIQKIVESEDKTVMKQFCGEHGITQQEYRDNMNLLNSEYELTEYKLSHFTPNVD